MITPGRKRDEIDLMALHLVDGEHLSALKAGRKVGLTKGTVIGMRWRVNKTQVIDVCEKPENQDGGMPELWWKK